MVSTAIAVLVLSIFLSLFTNKGIQKVFAGSLQKIWTGITDFTNNNSETANISNSNIDITTSPGDVKLSAVPTVTENSTAQFNSGTRSKTSVGTNAVYLLKPDGATASSGAECLSGIVSGGVCTSWYAGVSGVLVGKKVYYRDINSTDSPYFSDTLIWANHGVACTTGTGGSQPCQTGLDSLHASNASFISPQTYPTMDFSAFPAQNACKAIGGRLPTSAELSAIYTGKASYGNNFQTTTYWTSTEATVFYAYNRNLLGNSEANNYKESGKYVRCIKD